MKKFIGLLMAAVVLTSVAAFAGEGCCKGKGGADCFAKLNLTALREPAPGRFFGGL